MYIRACRGLALAGLTVLSFAPITARARSSTEHSAAAHGNTAVLSDHKSAAHGSTADPHTALSQVVVTAAYRRHTDLSMKMGAPVRDIPFSIDSYSHSFMRSIETRQIANLFQFMTGLQKAGVTGYDITIRGFSTNASASDRNTFMVDGLPGLAIRFGSPPTIDIEHIELVKGPSSLLYGSVTPGGFVNIITKKPQAVARTMIETRGTVDAGGYSRTRGGDVSFDSTGPLGSRRILYRVIGQISDDRYFRNFSHERNKFLMPMVTVNINDSTRLTAQFQYQSLSADYENVGLLAPLLGKTASSVAALAPIQTVYTAPGTTRDEKATATNVYFHHFMAGGGSINVSVRSVDHHDYAYAFDITGFDKADPAYQTLDLRARGQWNQRTYNFADANVVLPFHVGRFANRLLVGADVGKEIDDFRRTRFCAINSPGKPSADPSCNIGTNQYTVSVLNPDFSNIPPPSAFGAGKLADFFTVSKTAAAYLSDLVTVAPKWKVMVGVRYSKDKFTVTSNRFISPTERQTSSSTNPEFGIMYQPSDNLTYYASYSTSYTPISPSTRGLTTAPLFKPEQAWGAETGVKASFLHHRVDLTGALYLINETNVTAPYAGGVDTLCPTGSCKVQVGAARSKGAELEIDAKPTEELTLIGGYAYTDARVSASTPTSGSQIVGDQLTNSPLNAAHLWVRYDLFHGRLRGFGAGLGLVYVGSRVANTGTVSKPGEFVLPSYHLVDLAFYKQFENGLHMTLMLDNLLNSTYYQDGKITSGMISVSPGAPRTAALYLTYTF